MENEEGIKNIGYKALVLILLAMLCVSNIGQMIIHDGEIQSKENNIRALVSQITSIRVEEFENIDQFASELDCKYIYVKTIEPIGFVNYTTIMDATGDTRGFRTILYDVTFNWVTEEEVNGSIEVWMRNYTYAGLMNFDVAIANDQQPMEAGEIYKLFYVYNAYRYYNVIYYEKIETGRV